MTGTTRPRTMSRSTPLASPDGGANTAMSPKTKIQTEMTAWRANRSMSRRSAFMTERLNTSLRPSRRQAPSRACSLPASARSPLRSSTTAKRLTPHSVVLRDHLGRIDDAGRHEVFILLGLRVEALVVRHGLHALDDDRPLVARVRGDPAQGLFNRPDHDV